MPGISRRDLLCSGLALSASSLVARSAWGRAAALLAGYPQAGVGRGAGRGCAARAIALRFRLEVPLRQRHRSGPRPRLWLRPGRLCQDRRFRVCQGQVRRLKWRTLNLPHDWAVELPFVRDEEQTSHGYKPLGRRYPETSVGWYRREFEIPASDRAGASAVEFDGAFRDVLVFVNGCFIGRNDNGYAPFRFDLTDFLAVRREELHRGARRRQLRRWLVLRGRRHLSPRVAHQDRCAASGQVGEHGARRP